MVSVSREAVAAARVLVAGDVMLDRYWFGDVERISPEAPVPVVHVKREEFRLGGAANVAANVVALGARAALVSVVGDDEPGRRVRALVAAGGIEDLVSLDAALPTTVKLRVSGRAQQLLRIDFESTPATEVLATMGDAFAAALPRFDAVLVSDYGKGGVAHVAALIAAARARGVPVLVDPKGTDWSIYTGAAVVTPNRAELAQVVGRWHGEDDLAARAQGVRKRLGLAALLVTRSEEGMSLFDADGHLRVPATAREVFDVTGAGDTVIATLATLLAAGVPLREAVPVVNRAGGLVVGKYGTATVTYEELFG